MDAEQLTEKERVISKRRDVIESVEGVSQDSHILLVRELKR